MSEHVDDLLERVERLTRDDLVASRDEGFRDGRASAQGVVDGTMRRVDFVSLCVVAARRPLVHDEDTYALGFFSGVHSALLLVPPSRSMGTDR